MAQLMRVVQAPREPVDFLIDGRPARALAGDTVLTAVLLAADAVRRSEFSGAPRAGFCMMGACQDCWMRLADGTRLRACTTFIEAGMSLLTGLEAASAANGGQA